MSEQWRSRPGLARLIRVVVAVAPILLTIAISYALARALPPVGSGRERLAWWTFLLLVTLVSLYLLDKLFRRFAPLATLLKLSLVFPDEAPHRFSTALRAGSTKKLERKIEAIAQGGAAFDSTTAYAAQMLELIAMLGEHDRLTRGHCERVRAYTDLIMHEMGITGHDADRLRWAALLHDLGKLMVPAAILTKPTRPTDGEWKILKTHAAESARLAEPISDWLGEWYRTLGEHHERWDGEGYPAGLAGTDIHLGARVVAVADTYDVITSSRSYKNPIPAADARAEIARHAGSQFDPRVVRAFLSIGIGRLRFIAGPLAWITSLFGLSSAPVGVASTVTATALTIATVGAVAPGPTYEPLEDAVARNELGFSQTTTTSARSASTTTGQSTTTIEDASASGPLAPAAETTTTTEESGTSVPSTTTTFTTTTLPPTTASPSTSPATTPAPTSTTAPPPSLAVGPNLFAVAPETRTGDVVGTLSATNAPPDVRWLSTKSSPFSVDPDGTIRLADEELLYDNGMYGTNFSFPVTVTDPDGEAADG
ncbi:MAG: HD domain-containing protein, partial [Acidimicrobiia bacterium]|nr:HD domain-containing protein [Acidimicrobiia bacterium]